MARIGKACINNVWTEVDGDDDHESHQECFFISDSGVLIQDEPERVVVLDREGALELAHAILGYYQ